MNVFNYRKVLIDLIDLFWEFEFLFFIRISYIFIELVLVFWRFNKYVRFYRCGRILVM